MYLRSDLLLRLGAPPVAYDVAMEFTHVHSSGRFDRSNESLAKDLTSFHKVGSIVTHTEMSQDRRTAVFKANKDDGWEFYRSGEDFGQDECVIEWDSNVWKLDGEPRAIQMTKRRFKRSAGFMAPPIHVLKVNLRSVKNPKIVIVTMTAHLPVDKIPERAAIWHDIMRNWASWIRRYKKRRQGRKLLLIADWNKNFRQLSERAAISRYLWPLGLKASWAGNMPKRGGTFGPLGLIDGDYSNMKVVWCRLLPDTKSSDHRPYAARYRVSA